jgi:hypothetical protein
MASNIDPTLGGGTTKDGRDIDKAELQTAFQAAKDEMDAQQLLTVDFVGDSGSGGVKGLVPAPAAGDSGKFLKANGSWTTLPGGGDMLSTNNLSDVADAATSADNLGLGPTSNPQFNTVELGNASDTTLARSGAGDITVEGNAVYRAGGTDVAVADGGTGSSTAGGALTNLGAAASGANSDITSLSALSTALSVSQGGTGATTLTDGGILLGSGTGAITPMSVLADGEIVVGDGTTDPVALAAFSSSTGNLLSAKGGTIGKHTIFIPASAMRATVSNGAVALNDVETTAGRPDMTAFDFDATADEHVQFQICFPKGYNLGTVTAQFWWESTAADTDGVTWAIQGVAVSDNGTIDVAYGTAVTVDDANQGAAEELLVTAESSAITIAGTPADDDLCFFRVFRDVSDANDTATEDARLLGVKLFFTIDAGEDT